MIRRYCQTVVASTTRKRAFHIGVNGLCVIIGMVSTNLVTGVPPRDATGHVSVPVLAESDFVGSRVSIDYAEYCKQVAVTTLITSLHEITETEVRFQRDHRKRGNAIQQFAEAFGGAIESAVPPTFRPRIEIDAGDLATQR